MDHEAWFEVVSAGADDQLDGDERAQLEAHLATCTHCRSLLATFDQHRRSARLTPPTDHQALLSQVLGARERQRHAAGRTRRLLITRTAVVMAALAISAGTVAALTAGQLPARRSSTIASDQVVIDAHDAAFDQAHLHVQPGTTVDWHNADGTTHQLVRRLGGATVAEALEPGQTESATFGEPGVYRFYCEIHPEMTGTITVDA